ncbi:amino acid transporter AVT1H [Argentina anserina]|uniref:amino acid transporter AVT1H n=1 Tax=Argentina anserina TaxID=57926 RepID=UPI002176723C|nr:amino acid transporter AVT1H [Potentilla anserina]
MFNWFQSECLPHPNQVASDSVHGRNLALNELSCSVCLEENKVCKCEQSFESCKKVDSDVGDHEHHGEANNSVTHAVINMTGMLIGLGQLSTPYAIESGGWVSAFLMIGLGAICAYCSHLLGKCLDKNPKSRSYTDIGQNAFGTKGKLLAATFIYLEIFMALVSYTISLHDNINRVFSGTQVQIPWAKLSKSQLLTLLAVLVALPSLWLRDLSSISFLSFGGVLMSLAIFSSVACTGIFGGVKANHIIPALQIQNIPAISGLYIFSYAGHIVFPNLYKAMKDPSKFTKVSIISFSIVTLLYSSLAFMGAKLYGPQVNPQITLSMPPHLIVTKIALWATVLTPMTKYALEFAPMAIQVEHNLPDSMSSRTKLIVRGTVGSFLLLMILALALSVPYFQYVLSLTGSLVSIAICVIFPCAFYLKICWPQISRPLLVLNFILIAFGFVLGVLGTLSSSKLLMQNLSRAHS